jgi:glycosyltransferase involved in cell wall biosynthesis
MTVYNRAEYLASAIKSVYYSDYSNFELLIWDDGSTDNSVSIATSYAQKDKRIKLIAAPHQGRGLALQQAIEATKGKYLGLVDSDDLLHPSAIAETAGYLDVHPHVGMVYTECLLIDESDRVLGKDRRCRIPYSPQRLLIDFMTFHFRLFRREIYDKVGGFDVTLKAAIDYDLCLRFSEVTTIAQIKKPLYFYRRHRDSISGSQSLLQAYCAECAVKEALVRRGKADQLELKVQAQPKFFLRRKTKVANRVFGIGLSETRQYHLADTLNLMGIPTIHFPARLEQIKDFDGATGLPVALAYRELDKLYPDSKFILTIREVNSWLRSIQNEKLKQTDRNLLPSIIKEAEIQCYGSSDFDETLWLNAYDKHFFGVMNYFRGRERDLLIIDLFGQKDYQQQLEKFFGCL